MFLSELQSHAPSLERGDGLGVFEKHSEPELECENSDSSTTSSVTSVSVPTSPLNLECMPTNLFIDPLDDPFLSSFTDISTLQENFPLVTGGLSSPSPLVSGGLRSPSPLECNTVNVAVIESSESNVNSTERRLLNLSECIDLLTNTSSTAHLTAGTPPSSPTTTTSSSTCSSPQTSLFLCDFDFSVLSNDLFATAASTSTTEPNTPSSSTDSSSPSHDPDIALVLEAPPSHHQAPPTTGISAATGRKRKALADDRPESPSSEPEGTGHRKIRQDKNNMASQVCRAKRRQRSKQMERRVGDLEGENQKLREQEQELTVEIEKLKKLLLERLA